MLSVLEVLRAPDALSGNRRIIQKNMFCNGQGLAPESPERRREIIPDKPSSAWGLIGNSPLRIVQNYLFCIIRPLGRIYFAERFLKI